ncbi:hypothetical protein ABT095_14825 [Kitasatospora sp. NPDC002227]|uniref:hypothetical protein n=1 Tax=Kitasatospora sp. NPDC002227 TaxID=3154773 RepID=UPI003329F8D2
MADSLAGAPLQQARLDGLPLGPDFTWWPGQQAGGCGGCGHVQHGLSTEEEARDYQDGHLDVCVPTLAGRELWNRAVLTLSVPT